MAKFRTKPIEKEAMRFTGHNEDEIYEWAETVCSDTPPMIYSHEGDVLTIETPEGQLHARPGDWIICGIQGEFYPCKPDIFQATYEPVEE